MTDDGLEMKGGMEKALQTQVSVEVDHDPGAFAPTTCDDRDADRRWDRESGHSAGSVDGPAKARPPSEQRRGGSLRPRRRGRGGSSEIGVVRLIAPPLATPIPSFATGWRERSASRMDQSREGGERESPADRGVLEQSTASFAGIPAGTGFESRGFAMEGPGAGADTNPRGLEMGLSADGGQLENGEAGGMRSEERGSDEHRRHADNGGKEELAIDRVTGNRGGEEDQSSGNEGDEMHSSKGGDFSNGITVVPLNATAWPTAPRKVPIAHANDRKRHIECVELARRHARCVEVPGSSCNALPRHRCPTLTIAIPSTLPRVVLAPGNASPSPRLFHVLPCDAAAEGKWRRIAASIAEAGGSRKRLETDKRVPGTECIVQVDDVLHRAVILAAPFNEPAIVHLVDEGRWMIAPVEMLVEFNPHGKPDMAFLSEPAMALPCRLRECEKMPQAIDDERLLVEMPEAMLRFKAMKKIPNTIFKRLTPGRFEVEIVDRAMDGVYIVDLLDEEMADGFGK